MKLKTFAIAAMGAIISTHGAFAQKKPLEEGVKKDTLGFFLPSGKVNVAKLDSAVLHAKKHGYRYTRHKDPEGGFWDDFKGRMPPYGFDPFDDPIVFSYQIFQDGNGKLRFVRLEDLVVSSPEYSKSYLKSVRENAKKPLSARIAAALLSRSNIQNEMELGYLDIQNLVIKAEGRINPHKNAKWRQLGLIQNRHFEQYDSDSLNAAKYGPVYGYCDSGGEWALTRLDQDGKTARFRLLEEDASPQKNVKFRISIDEKSGLRIELKSHEYLDAAYLFDEKTGNIAYLGSHRGEGRIFKAKIPEDKRDWTLVIAYGASIVIAGKADWAGTKTIESLDVFY